MSATASQITGVSMLCSTVWSGADQRKHQSFTSLASVRGIHRWPVNSPHKGPVTRKMFPFDDVTMISPDNSLYHVGFATHVPTSGKHFRWLLMFRRLFWARCPFHERFFHRNSNSMDNWFSWNSTVEYHIASKCGTCHGIAVVLCTKFLSYHFNTT